MIIEDDPIKIQIKDYILKRIHLHCQVSIGLPESGGLLMGRENISNGNLIIDEISEPMKKDKRTRNRFIRRDIAHVSLFNNRYEASDGTIRYVGEWHTHPENDPQYSLIDLNNWKRIKSESKNVINQYHIIAGIEYISIWKCCNSKELPQKIGSYKWEDIFSEESVVSNL